MPLTPWYRRIAWLWQEDDVTVHDEMHEGLAETWARLYGSPLNRKEAVEKYDAGDAVFYRFADDRVVCCSYPGNNAVGAVVAGIICPLYRCQVRSG